MDDDLERSMERWKKIEMQKKKDRYMYTNKDWWRDRKKQGNRQSKDSEIKRQKKTLERQKKRFRKID